MGKTINRMNYEDIAKTILGLRDADMELRENLISTGQLGEGYNEKMAALHDKNAETLNDIINIIGYPEIDKVGKKASEAAWLVIQHSIGKPEFMRKCAKLLEKAVSKNNTDPQSLAYLTDRIAVFEGRPQLYGTQFDWDKNGEMSPNLFDDLTKVNQRRKSIGLTPLEEQIDLMRSRVKTENQSPPADFNERQMEMKKWRKSVGWTK